MRVAEILAIGDEILSGDILNSNAQYLSAELSKVDVLVNFHSAVRDDETEIPRALLNAAERADIVVVTGGLGPTADDFTLEMAAKAFGVAQHFDPQALQSLEAFYKRFNREVSETNKKQAYFPVGAKVLPNPVGTAPGAYFQFQNTKFYFLPGVPREMKTIFQESILPKFKNANPKRMTQFLKCFGLPESEMQNRLKDLFTSRSHIGDVQIGFRASLPDVLLKLTAESDDHFSAQEKILKVQNQVAERIQDFIYASDLSVTLEQLVVEKFVQNKKTLAVAESCTGGLVSHRITNISGASQMFVAGLTTYANEMKMAVLGVQEDTLKKFGAVSEECAREMVLGLQKISNADVCVATTGIAGPTGGTEDKPVGTVFVAYLSGKTVSVTKHHFPFGRDNFKQMTSSRVLFDLQKSY